jgi:hypothetical protein
MSTNIYTGRCCYQANQPMSAHLNFIHQPAPCRAPHVTVNPPPYPAGSDFNEPVRRCLDRLTDAKWANSDILLVSGERAEGAPRLTGRCAETDRHATVSCLHVCHMTLHEYEPLRMALQL